MDASLARSASQIVEAQSPIDSTYVHQPGA